MSKKTTVTDYFEDGKLVKRVTETSDEDRYDWWYHPYRYGYPYGSNWIITADTTKPSVLVNGL